MRYKLSSYVRDQLRVNHLSSLRSQQQTEIKEDLVSVYPT